MIFAEKLKSIRKQSGMSQEQLAEKLGVSRQAVTKWETDAGIPDIENIKAISSLFDISIDELLSNDILKKKLSDYLFENVTEYDIDEPKHYDMKFGGAKRLILSGYEGKNIRVLLVSNTLSTLKSDFEIKINDIGNGINVDVKRKNGVTETIAKENVSIFVQIPTAFIEKLECAVDAGKLEIRALKSDSIGLDIKTSNLILEDVIGTVEINCNLNMNIICRTLKGTVELNQVSAISKICLPRGIPFATVTQGVDTSISYERKGQKAENFSVDEADNIVKLNGIKSKLVISQAP